MPMAMQCPFFKRDCYLKLYCEAGTVKFPDWQGRGEYVESFCANARNWKNCTLAPMLEKYYERKED